MFDAPPEEKFYAYFYENEFWAILYGVPPIEGQTSFEAMVVMMAHRSLRQELQRNMCARFAGMLNAGLKT